MVNTARVEEPIDIHESNFMKIKTYLDSGANEFLLKQKSLAKDLKDVCTTIETAGGGKDLSATSTGQVDFYFADLRTRVPMGTANRALFSEGLVDNLASVSRLTETGLKVIFDKEGYRIVKGDVAIRGVVVHKEAKEPQSGLYPLTLFVQNEVQKNLDQSKVLGTFVESCRALLPGQTKEMSQPGPDA